MVYMLFFSVLAVAFAQISSLACDTLQKVFDFIKIFSVAYFTCITFTYGSIAGSVFYEFTLVMMNVASYVIVKFALPAIEFYFFFVLQARFRRKICFQNSQTLLKI